jgi:Thrombospondin type 1 domain
MHQCNKQLCNPTTTKYKATKGHTSSSAGNHQWTADGWGPCTSECNGGSQARRVYCLHLLLNGTKHIVGDFHCTKHTQPATERRCNNHACPQWQTSSWSACSATCGRGTQVRTVKCVDHKGFDNDMQCDKTIRPSDRKVCKVSSYCPMDSRPSSTTKSYTSLNPNGTWSHNHWWAFYCFTTFFILWLI